MPRFEADCPTCDTPIESYELASGLLATYPSAVAVPGGGFADGHQIGVGEAPGPMYGMTPSITSAPDHDVMTLHPCGHVLNGPEVHELRFRMRQDIPEPLRIGAPAIDMELKADDDRVTVSLNAPSGVRARSLDRAQAARVRDWLTKYLDETA